MSSRGIIYLALLVLIVSSCLSNKVEENDPDINLAFNVIVKSHTRADDIDADYPLDVPFGVWSYSLPADKSWIKDSKEAVEVQNQEAVIYDNISGLWKPKSNMLWLSSENSMSFFAYSPYSRACSFSKEKGIYITDFSINEECDLLFSEYIYDLNKLSANGVVNIPFISALTKVEFQIRSSLPDGSIIRVKHLKLRNVASVGDFFSLPEAGWENHSGYDDFTFFEGEVEIGDEPSILGECRQMIPQTIHPTIEMLCDIISGDYVLYDQILTVDGRMNWSIGKVCTYNLKVTTDLTFIIESSLNE
jgi:hypothetical protein